MNDLKHDVKNAVETALSDLRSMRDEIRLKVHLASMEARDRWHALEPRLASVEHQLEKGGTSVAETLRDSVEDLRRSLVKLRDEIARRSHA
jgi:hypothetical protein